VYPVRPDRRSPAARQVSARCAGTGTGRLAPWREKDDDHGTADRPGGPGHRGRSWARPRTRPGAGGRGGGRCRQRLRQRHPGHCPRGHAGPAGGQRDPGGGRERGGERPRRQFLGRRRRDDRFHHRPLRRPRRARQQRRDLPVRDSCQAHRGGLAGCDRGAPDGPRGAHGACDGLLAGAVQGGSAGERVGRAHLVGGRVHRQLRGGRLRSGQAGRPGPVPGGLAGGQRLRRALQRHRALGPHPPDPHGTRSAAGAVAPRSADSRIGLPPCGVAGWSRLPRGRADLPHPR